MTTTAPTDPDVRAVQRRTLATAAGVVSVLGGLAVWAIRARPTGP